MNQEGWKKKKKDKMGHTIKSLPREKRYYLQCLVESRNGLEK